MDKNICKICGSQVALAFKKKVLKKYDVSYYTCSQCGFMQTEEPYWLDESYASAITSLDVGLVNRNIQYAQKIEELLYKYFDVHKKFLDFAGGHGMFTRIMRDKGFDFYHEDKFCENTFANSFDINDLPVSERKFEVVTAFEFVEHAADLYRELDYVFSMTENFIFSTELLPDNNIENWWYIGEEHGQHIAFHTKNSLKFIAKRYNKNYYTNGYLHLITSKKINNPFEKSNEFKVKILNIFNVLIPPNRLPSRTQSDFEKIREQIHEKK